MNNPLALIPHQYRAAIYALVTLASICFTAWQLSDGDWVEALGQVLGVLAGGVAVSNVRAHGRPRDDRGGITLVGVLVVVVIVAVIFAITRAL